MSSYTLEPIAPQSATVLGSSEPLPERVFDPYARHETKSQQAIKRAESAIAGGHVDKGGATQAVESKPLAESVSLSPGAAALARREQKFRQEQQALKVEKEALDKERAEIAELKAMKAKLASKDYSGLDGLVDYNEYSQYEVTRQNSSDPAQQALKKLEEKVTSIEKSHEENITKQFEAAVTERRIAVKALIESDERFAGIKKLKFEEHVVQHILDTWEHDSKELSVEDAAKEVQELILEKANQWASVIPPSVAAVEEKKPLPALKSGLKTLTNQVTSGDVKKPLKPLHLMSDSERYAEARRRAEEKLGGLVQRRG